MAKNPSPAEPTDRPILTVDVVLFTLREGRLHVALLERPAPPCAGMLALIGGYVRVEDDADTDAAAARVLREKAGLDGVYIEQLMSFSGRNRDPRGWSAAIIYLAVLPEERLGGAHGLVLKPVDDAGPLAFDHAAIIAAARARLQSKATYSTLPARLLPDEFTLPEMLAVYEAVIGERLDQSSFRRKLTELGAIEAVAGATRTSATVRRPAQLYRLKAPIALFDRRL